MNTMVRELMAVQLFEERVARVFADMQVEEAAERASVRSVARRRKRRERVARVLKALAMRLAPTIAIPEATTNTVSTAT